MTSICLDNCYHPSWHAFYKVLTYLWRYFIPLLGHSLPEFMNSLRWLFIFLKFPLDVKPKVFNGDEVRRLSWPMNHNNLIVRKPSGGQFGGVLGVIFLLKVSLPLLHVQSFPPPPHPKSHNTAEHPSFPQPPLTFPPYSNPYNPKP